MGKSGGPLSAWIREFTTLVFVQTVQAFIFAIIILLIMSAMDPDGIGSNDYNVGVGIMSVFALTSLFKVEEIVKKIFGIQGTKADHGNAVKSIAKTAFAAKIGKRALDNGKKIVGGAKDWNKANKDIKKNRERYKEDLEDMRLRKPGASSNTPNNTLLGAGGTSTRPSNDTSASVSMANTGNDFADTNELLSRQVLDPKQQQKLREKKRHYEEREAELRKNRKQAILNIGEGLAETGGVIIGAPMGAILGGADGNIDEALQGAVSGAGVGDAVGSAAFKTAVATVNATGSIIKTGKAGVDLAKSTSDTISDFKQEVKAARENIEREMEAEGKDLNNIQINIDAVKTTVKTRKANRPASKKSIAQIEKEYLDANNIRYGTSVDDI